VEQFADIIASFTPSSMMTVVVMAMACMVVIFFIMRRLRKTRHIVKLGITGSQLQHRVIKVFSLVTIIPTLIISFFSIVFFYYGVKDWFNQNITTVLNESVAVAESYLVEHQSNLRADAMAMTKDLQRELHLIITNPVTFENILNGQVVVRTLSEALILQRQKVIARSQLSFSLIFETLPDHIIENARSGEVVLWENEDRLFAIVALDPVSELYLVISRLVDSKVLDHIEESKGAAAKYTTIRQNINHLQISFIVGFCFVVIGLLLSVIWYGISFASRLTIPLITLAQATQRVGEGDYSIQIEENKNNDEMNMLIAHFNRMTQQLHRQRHELTQATRMLDQRRRFTEAVLSGVSAGIIALDTDFVVTLCNQSALRLLGCMQEESLIGNPLVRISGEFATLLEQVRLRPSEVHQAQITVRAFGKNVILQVKVSAEASQRYVEGFIVALDDITPLIAAQRSAAWSDVARRVAHEIKNPLTPIKLSLDRLKKKFEPDEPEAREAYHKYLGTINRHISDIARIVEEFAAFARLPAPKLQEVALDALLEQAIFSAETIHPEITYSFMGSERPMVIHADEVQLSQVFTNLLKNAAESIERREHITQKGRIEIHYHTSAQQVMIEVADNGVGFPEELLHRIMEPYVTTRTKGTGLGLAIVKKIIEDHKGTISLANRPLGGALITIALPRPINNS
jgi:two-component system nitrogen regulation sensor histidine kinase NtrY